MPDDVGFSMTYPCYFLYKDNGELQCNTVDGHACLCLFTTEAGVQQFHQAIQAHQDLPRFGRIQFAVDEVKDYAGLINRLTLGEAHLLGAGINHIVIDPKLGQAVTYTTVREFIEELPR